jgi:hypothetical protein
MTPDEQSADRAVLEAARAIRPFLVALLGPEPGAEADQELARLLAEAAAGKQVRDEVLARLRRTAPTRAWWLAFAATLLPPEVVHDPSHRGSLGLPGHGPPSLPARYACPQGDYVWYRRGVTEPVPVCPTHSERLKPQPSGG